jgi:hypothetical protein
MLLVFLQSPISLEGLPLIIAEFEFLFHKILVEKYNLLHCGLQIFHSFTTCCRNILFALVMGVGSLLAEGGGQMVNGTYKQLVYCVFEP